MAHFRGTIKGARGQASRLGTKASGLTVRAQTWGWDAVVDVRHWSEKDVAHDSTLAAGDWAVIDIVRHDGGDRKFVARVNLTTGEII